MIRLGQLHEKAALEALQLRASLAIDEYRELLLAHPDAIELPKSQLVNGHVLVDTDRDVPIGFAALEVRDDGSAALDGLFVDPPRWGEGIGRQLVNATVYLALDLGLEKLTVIASPTARGFYEKCGFAGLGLTATRFGPAIEMVKVF